MPAERISMRQLREILRLLSAGDVPVREIARRTGVAPSTVRATPVSPRPSASPPPRSPRIPQPPRRSPLHTGARPRNPARAARPGQRHRQPVIDPVGHFLDDLRDVLVAQHAEHRVGAGEKPHAVQVARQVRRRMRVVGDVEHGQRLALQQHPATGRGDAGVDRHVGGDVAAAVQDRVDLPAVPVAGQRGPPVAEVGPVAQDVPVVGSDCDAPAHVRDRVGPGPVAQPPPGRHRHR